MFPLSRRLNLTFSRVYDGEGRDWPLGMTACSPGCRAQTEDAQNRRKNGEQFRGRAVGQTITNLPTKIAPPCGRRGLASCLGERPQGVRPARNACGRVVPASLCPERRWQTPHTATAPAQAWRRSHAHSRWRRCNRPPIAAVIHAPDFRADGPRHVHGDQRSARSQKKALGRVQGVPSAVLTHDVAQIVDVKRGGGHGERDRQVVNTPPLSVNAVLPPALLV